LKAANKEIDDLKGKLVAAKEIIGRRDASIDLLSAEKSALQSQIVSLEKQGQEDCGKIEGLQAALEKEKRAREEGERKYAAEAEKLAHKDIEVRKKKTTLCIERRSGSTNP
jgi:chromosome segregation ATPase